MLDGPGATAPPLAVPGPWQPARDVRSAAGHGPGLELPPRHEADTALPRANAAGGAQSIWNQFRLEPRSPARDRPTALAADPAPGGRPWLSAPPGRNAAHFFCWPALDLLDVASRATHASDPRWFAL